MIEALLLAAAACRPSAGAPRLDHVVIVVRNLDSAAARFGPLGFRFKAGRLHPDSLLNRHIKFRDHSELELQSLAGAPTDAMAQDYADLLAEGEGGAYAALWAADTGPVAAVAAAAGLATRATVAGVWRFLGFPGAGDAAAVFFGSGGLPPVDPDSVLAHPNGAVGLDAVWVEAGPGLDRLLLGLGAASCDSVSLPGGRWGVRWALGRGSLVAVRKPRGSGSPRVIGAELIRSGAASGRSPQLLQPLPGFWILLR